MYGKPALVMAVNQYVKTSIRTNSSSTLRFRIAHRGEPLNLGYTFAELSLLRRRLELRYQQFLNCECALRNVLKSPLEILPFAFCTIIKENNVELVQGVDVHLDIGLPLGSGMGSSAATALSILQATASHYKTELTSQDYYEYAMQCEQLCHGTPSGVDPYISLHGGFIRFQNGQSKSLRVPKSRFYLALTGTPDSSTGECVLRVKERFAKHAIWNEFEEVTASLQEALVLDYYPSICDTVRRNHQLLTEIGVVPYTVQKFISDIEKQNGAAKISGAGSISGDSAGAVLIFLQRAPKELCSHYGYQLLQIECDKHGLRFL